MEATENQIIQGIRSYNRFYTDLLGLLNGHILDSAYSLTEVRILYEIDKIRNCTANLLMDKLNIDRGYMSRILKRFESNGLILRESSSRDGRALYLSLTPTGKSILSGLQEKSDNQVKGLISHLAEGEQFKLFNSMNYIKQALMDGLNPVTLRPYCAGDLDYIIFRQIELYEDEYGFGPEFGKYVEKYVRRFHEKHDENENLWIAEMDNRPAGVIAIVKSGDAAQLRWFFIEPEVRGRGVGHKLIRKAIDFCREKNYRHIYLLTVSILDAARHLYKSYGFKVTEAKDNREWGLTLREERWDLYL